MFSKSIFATTLIAVASANSDWESHVEIFDQENCKGHMLDRDLAYGECHTMKKDLSVPEISNKGYGHVKQSGDNINEVYFFHSKDECEKYGNSFNKDIEVTFIRAPGRDECYSVMRGGNAKSIRFTAKGSNKVENKSGDANTVIASTLAILAASTATMLF